MIVFARAAVGARRALRRHPAAGRRGRGARCPTMRAPARPALLLGALAIARAVPAHHVRRARGAVGPDRGADLARLAVRGAVRAADRPAPSGSTAARRSACVVGLAGVALRRRRRVGGTRSASSSARWRCSARPPATRSRASSSSALRALPSIRRRFISVTAGALLTLPAGLATAPDHAPGAARDAGPARARRRRHGARLRHLLQADRRGRRGPRVAGHLPRARRRALLRRACCSTRRSPPRRSAAWC